MLNKNNKATKEELNILKKEVDNLENFVKEGFSKLESRMEKLETKVEDVRDVLIDLKGDLREIKGEKQGEENIKKKYWELIKLVITLAFGAVGFKILEFIYSSVIYH